MPGRPRQELSPQEGAKIRAAYKKVKASQRTAEKDRRRLVQAVAEIDKPAAVARELGVDVSTIAYWIRTLDDRPG
jgi:hypothetical protein